MAEPTHHLDPALLEPGDEIVVNGRRLTVAMVVPRRDGFDIAPTCGAPVRYTPLVDGPLQLP